MKRSDYPTVVAWLMVHAVVVAAVGLVLFAAPGAQGGAAAFRRVLVFACSVVIFVRMAITSLLLLPRSMGVGEAAAVDAWLAVIHLTFAYSAVSNPQAVGVLFWIGLALFVAGSVMNTGSEIGRMRFRRRSENAGHLYTGGLFAYSMHPNYLGDIVYSIGMAIIAGRAFGFAVPALMTVMFVFIHIPRLDAHLKAKYGAQFERYRRRTAKLIPWVY